MESGIVRNMRPRSHLTRLTAFAAAAWVVAGASALRAEEGFKCPPASSIGVTLSRSSVYADVPFKPGENAKYELKYGLLKVLVGYGSLIVKPPVMNEVVTHAKDGKPVREKVWHRVFHADAFTGDWYKMIFMGHDKIEALSRPWDFGVSNFYISQDEEKPFVRRYRTEKWLDFDHVSCKVNTREKDYLKPEKSKEGAFDLHPASLDVLGALYKLRTYDYRIGRSVSFPVYSSEKNWILEASAVREESVEVNAGKFEAIVLKLKTFIGKELQQRGDLYVWLAHKHPNRPVVKIEGKVTFGNVYLLLHEFKPGS